jgi:septal ring factor EnvC (AmiA/AmiB activator)
MEISRRKRKINSMRGDNAPIKNTCPLIDKIINQVDDWYRSSEEIPKLGYADFEKSMEEIRSANSTLREWGNDECKRANDLEKELDSAKDEIEKLNDKIESLKSEIKDLEKELSEQENSNLA